MTHSEATVRGHRAMEFSSGNEALQTLALYEGSRGRFHQSQLNGGEKNSTPASPGAGAAGNARACH